LSSGEASDVTRIEGTSFSAGSPLARVTNSNPFIPGISTSQMNSP
jgi:hypothetical protein